MAYEFTRGLHDLGNGCFAFLQPNGGWGWSNSGLIVSRGESLLVDTLTDVPLTRGMLDEMKRKVPASAEIDTVVITHANPDHFLGSELVADSRILATEKTRAAIESFNPKMLEGLQRDWQQHGDAGWFFHQTTHGRFDFSGITLVPPNEDIRDERVVYVGDKRVIIRDLGPAHTESDAIVYVPDDRVVYTGDLLFNQGHPVVWEGPFASWIAACDHILDLDVDIIVPGHGPIADKDAVRALRHYFEYVGEESRKRFVAGMNFFDAAKEIEMDAFRGWIDGERLVGNVFSAYKELDPEHHLKIDPEIGADAGNLLALMGKWVKTCGWGCGTCGVGHSH